MTLGKNKFFLALVLIIIFCISFYILAWQHMDGRHIRKYYLQHAVAAQIILSSNDDQEMNDMFANRHNVGPGPGIAPEMDSPQFRTFKKSSESPKKDLLQEKSHITLPSEPQTKENGSVYNFNAENFTGSSNSNLSSAYVQNRTADKSTIKAHPVFTRPHDVKTKEVTEVGDSKLLQLKVVTSLPLMQKESFKKMPEWDFEDQYIQDIHPKPVTCLESSRSAADLEFNRSFIPNIQLFMHQGHLNISEWNRLAHFNNPFGFMGYHYADIKKAVDLIPKLKDYNLLPLPSTSKSGCIRCAVVGTGGILNGSRMGKEIDSHDYVFRMNGALLQGHEEDVGNRTSVYVHTAFSLSTSHYTLHKHGFRIPHDEGVKYVLIPEGLRDFQWLRGLLQKKPVARGEFKNIQPWKYYPEELDLNRFYVLHPDFLRYIKNRFLKSKSLEYPYWHLYRPSNGAFAMFLALHTCNVVDAYGFITSDYSKYSNYYYETSKTKVIFYVNHDYILEMKVWKKLHDSKVIRLYQREGDAEEVQTKPHPPNNSVTKKKT